jgi:uncharacterized protein
MQFTVADLEREPIQFSVALPPAAIDFGGEAKQLSDLASEGRAEVLHEHRGPKEIVADIRLKGSFRGTFEAPCARCVEPVQRGFPESLTCSFGRRGGCHRRGARNFHAGDGNRVL